MIALEIMGGDYAPLVPLEAALLAAKQGISLLLVGPQDIIVEGLTKLDPQWKSYPLQICDAPEVIGMDEEPVRGLQKKPNASIVVAMKALKEGRVSGVISAGNSGATMAAAVFTLGRINGVTRPAIAGFMPHPTKPVLVLDLGANTDCKPHYLEEFALLGINYLTSVHGKHSPRVALLSNGHESTKGNQLVKETHALLAQNTAINFVGNIEPDRAFVEDVDIIVCDGFAGNIFLKSVEGAAKVVIDLISREVALLKKGETEESKTIASWAANTLKALSKKADCKEHGGALLLGVNGTVVVAHGSATTKQLLSGIELTWEAGAKKTITGSTVIKEARNERSI
jgi:glycerol-3-phosphate acyltransferase PlsX